MALFKQVLKLLAIITSIEYVVAETEDLSTLLSNSVIEELMMRVRALEVQDKIQQDRITELESRETELESHGLAQQTLITNLETIVKDQQDQIKEMKRSIKVTSLNDKNLPEAPTDTTDEIKVTENNDLVKGIICFNSLITFVFAGRFSCTQREIDVYTPNIQLSFVHNKFSVKL